jgi:hypothetical protein
MVERTCEDCNGSMEGRDPQAVFCKTCFAARQRRNRRDAYARWKAAHPGATRRARYNGTVGTEVTCATPGCGNRFIKKSGVHKFCDECRVANEAYHDSVWNRKHPNRPFGPKVRALKAAA